MKIMEGALKVFHHDSAYNKNKFNLKPVGGNEVEGTWLPLTREQLREELALLVTYALNEGAMNVDSYGENRMSKYDVEEYLKSIGLSPVEGGE